MNFTIHIFEHDDMFHAHIEGVNSGNNYILKSLTLEALLDDMKTILNSDQ